MLPACDECGRPCYASCVRCLAPTCGYCNRCAGCGEAVCDACDGVPTPPFRFTGDLNPHPHYEPSGEAADD